MTTAVLEPRQLVTVWVAGRQLKTTQFTSRPAARLTFVRLAYPLDLDM